MAMPMPTPMSIGEEGEEVEVEVAAAMSAPRTAARHGTRNGHLGWCAAEARARTR